MDELRWGMLNIWGSCLPKSEESSQLARAPFPEQSSRKLQGGNKKVPIRRKISESLQRVNIFLWPRSFMLRKVFGHSMTLAGSQRQGP